MSDMVKYRATLWSFLKLTALVYYHVWHSPLSDKLLVIDDPYLTEQKDSTKDYFIAHKLTIVRFLKNLVIFKNSHSNLKNVLLKY